MNFREVEKGAEVSADGQYRFTLTRSWRHPPQCIGGSVLWIGHNPSTADAEKDDPTVRRMIEFSDSWGYGRLALVNLLPFRTSSPYEAHKWFWEKWSVEDWVNATGRPKAILDNARAIDEQRQDAAKIIACWGAIAGPVANLALDVRKYLAERNIPLCILSLTGEGYPSHPLARGKSYVPYTAKPTIWEYPN